MAKKSYIGISGKSKLVPNKGYIGIKNKSKKLLKGYVGVNGKAKLFWEAVKKITESIFSSITGFSFVGNVVSYTATKFVSEYGQRYVKYYVGDFGTAKLYSGKYSCYVCVDMQSSGFGYENPITGTFDGTVYTLNIPGGTNCTWWLTIPTLLFGVSQIEFVLDGYGYFTNVYVGIATRVRDEGDETPTVSQAGLTINSGKNVYASCSVEDARADYIYISATNVLGLSTKISIRSVTVTYERTYGIVKTDSIQYHVNFPRHAFVYNGAMQYDAAVIESASAVYMLVFDTDNTFSDEDYEEKETFGTGDIYFVYISKNTFTVKKDLLDIVDNYGNYTTEIATYQNKTTYYVLVKYENLYQNHMFPGYKYAYTHYSGWADDPAPAIGKMGKEILYDGKII